MMDLGTGSCLLTLSLLVTVLTFIQADVPQFVVNPQSDIVRVSSKVTLFCRLSPNDSVTQIHWLYDGAKISRHVPGIQLSFGQMIIESFTNSTLPSGPGGQGSYQCLAESDIGSVLSLEAYIEAAYIGEFYEGNQDVYINVTEGNVAVIPCAPISGRPRPRIHFELNNTQLDTDTGRYHVLPSGDLQIANVSPKDQGLYRCVAYNNVSQELRKTKQLVHLNVLSAMVDEPPVFHVVPSLSVKAVIHTNLTLECVVQGAPIPVVTWSKYGGKLPTGRYRQFLGNLELYNVGRLDEGTYICRADNHVGPKQVAISKVLVQEPPTITVHPQSQHVNIGERVSFECVGHGKPAITTEWFYNGRRVKSGRGSVTLNDTVLTIDRVQAKHAGIYQCFVQNTLGSVTLVAQLTVDTDRLKRIPNKQKQTLASQSEDSVSGHPYIVDLPENSTVVIGQSVTLTCATNRRQDVQYGENFLWLRDSTTIEHLVIEKGKEVRVKAEARVQRSELRVLRNGSLRITNAQLSDSGLYTCVLWVDGMSDSASAYLTVRQIGDTTQSKGGATNQPTRSSSTGSPHDGMSAGGHETWEKDRLIPELVPPSRPQVTKTSQTSVVLQWSVDDDAGLPITFFKVQYKELVSDKQKRRWRTIDEDIPAHVRQFEVTSLKPGSTYRFRIVAVYSNNDNKHGANSRKFTLTTDRRMNVPDAGPVIVEAKALSAYSIALKWQYLPEEWTPLDGFVIYYQMYGTDADPHTLTIHDMNVREAQLTQLNPTTVYMIRMKGFNTAGQSQFSNTVVKRTMSPSDVEEEYDYNMYPPFGVEDNSDGSQSVMTSSVPVVPAGNELESSLTTSQSDKILYIVVGSVLGILVAFLLFFMAICAWKQQKRSQRLATISKFGNQAEGIHGEQKEMKHFILSSINGTNSINGVNGMARPNLTNGHVPGTYMYPQINITQNPLAEQQVNNCNHIQCTEQTSLTSSPTNTSQRASDTDNMSTSEGPMTTFGPTVRSVYHVHDQSPADHIPRSHEQLPYQHRKARQKRQQNDDIHSDSTSNHGSQYTDHDETSTNHDSHCTKWDHTEGDEIQGHFHGSQQ